MDDLPDYFPDVDVEQNVAEVWDFTYTVPYPKIQFACPVCRHDQILAKDWKYHKRTDTGSAHPYRCDVAFKCTRCSHVWWHGVRVPKEKYLGGKKIFWRRVKQAIAKGRPIQRNNG